MAKFKAHLYETEHSGFYDNNDVKHIPYFLPSAWTTFTPEQITTATFNMVPKTWTKFTVTDGDWMTKNTLIPLSSRDLYLADLLDNLNPKIKTFVPGSHTTITTDARGLKYINQYYNAEDFKEEFNCDQGTISIDFIDEDEAEIKLINNTFDLSTDNRCQNWNFTNELSCTNLTALNNTATFIDLTAINHNNTHLTSTSGQATRLNKDFSNAVIYSTSFSATNLDALSLITPNDYKVSNDVSALNATFSGAGADNKSLCVNGTANHLTALNDFKIQANVNISAVTSTNTISTAIKSTNLNYSTAYFSALSAKNLSAINIDKVSNVITANRAVYGMSYNNTASYMSANYLTAAGSTVSNMLSVTNTNYNAFNVSGDFKVFSAAEPQKHSLSGILTNIRNAQTKNTIGIIGYEPDNSSVIIYHNKDIPNGAVTEYNSTNLNNLIKNDNLNTIIFRLGNLSRTTNVILPINVSLCNPTLTYHINLVVFDNHQKNRFIVRFFDTVKSNFYFYNAPKSIRSFNTYYIEPVVWPTKRSGTRDFPDLSNVNSFFTNVPANGGVYAVYGSSMHSDWSSEENPDADWLDDYAKYNKVWGVLNKNIMFKVSNTDEGHFIYFLNGNNY